MPLAPPSSSDGSGVPIVTNAAVFADTGADTPSARRHQLAGKNAVDAQAPGAAGRDVLAQVRAAGGHVAAFVDSDRTRAGSDCAGVPVVSPDDLARATARPYVLVASMHAADIRAVLTVLGWQNAVDYHVAGVRAVPPPVIGVAA